jgi:hypothetical protein
MRPKLPEPIRDVRAVGRDARSRVLRAVVRLTSELENP